MHVEIIKVSTKIEDPTNHLESTIDLDDNFTDDPRENVFQEQKIQNFNVEVATSSQLQSSLANKEVKQIKDGTNGKEKEFNHNGNHTLMNSKILKPKEIKIFKNKGRWICKDTKEIKNESREIATQSINGKHSNIISNQLVAHLPHTSDPPDEVNIKVAPVQVHIPVPIPIPAPVSVPEHPPPSIFIKPRDTSTVLNSIINTPVIPIENKINSIFKDTWDVYKQGVVHNLTNMYQQETQNLNDRIRQLIGLLTELQNENISLRSELEKNLSQHQPPH